MSAQQAARPALMNLTPSDGDCKMTFSLDVGVHAMGTGFRVAASASIADDDDDNNGTLLASEMGVAMAEEDMLLVWSDIVSVKRGAFSI